MNKIKNNKEFIELLRSIFDWQWYYDINTTRLFIHLLLKVNLEDRKWRELTIKSGSLVGTVNALSLETNLSIQQVRTALNKLKSSNEITIKSNKKFSIISINDWIKNG